ncbi:MAG TPA: SDR family NAD(P)-dependent oxidoreductase, partial [Planctomycetota bacterium]|nr:SDR family NAD(P)-dependent oxidoreductase [Planctomycetota bacterium]
IDEFRRRTQRDLRKVWTAASDPDYASRELQRPSLQLPAIFILEYALAQLWMSIGVRPTALLGHSLGENTAACLAGVFSYEDALGLVALRGELFELLPRGGMLSVGLPADELQRHLGPMLDLAAVNSPTLSVVSGPTEALDELGRKLAASGIEAQRIPIATAAHSRLVEPILPRFLAFLRSIELQAPRIPFLSNSTGTWIRPEQAVSPEYWVEHLRNTVRFSDGVRTLLEGPAAVLLEVGPGKSLASLARQEPGAVRARGVLSTLRHADEKITDVAHFRTAAGRLWACGVELDLKFLWRGGRRERVTLPTYPFQRRRYWIEPGKPVEQAAEVSTDARPVELLAKGFARPVWKAKPVEPAVEAGSPSEWLLFVDAAGIGETLAERLRARGERVITVRDSDDNCRLSPDEFSIAPERGRDGYIELVRGLVAAGRMPQRVVHMWLLTPDESCRPGSNFFHRNQERGFYSLFFLAQALGSEGLDAPLHVSVVSNGMQALDGEPLLHPGKATVLGPCKVIPREFPGITCKSIDVPLPVSKTRRRFATQMSLPKALATALEAEVSAPPCCGVVALRDSGRYEQEFESVEIPPAKSNGHAPIRQHAVVLITGGLGGIGLALASHLARTAEARLVLVGRSALPPRAEWSEWLTRHGSEDATSRRILAIADCEAHGSEVLVAQADVTDVEAMSGVLDQTLERFGALHGVVHAAGVLRDAPILSKTQQEVEEVFAAKVHGTLVLDMLLRDVDLDFFVLFSSASAIVAPPGQVDYVAANCFLDAHARSAEANAARRGGSALRRHTVAVDWGIWKLGMALDALQTRPSAAPLRPPSRARHPLFDSRGSDPDAPIVLRARWTPRERWILDEHRTREGRAIVPGSAYVEFARAAAIEAGDSGCFELRDLLLLRPLHVRDGEARDVEVELRPEDRGFHFSVRSRAVPTEGAPSPAWETHAQASLSLDAPALPAALPLAEIEARCRVLRAAAGPQALSCAQEDLAGFGPRWQTLREVRAGAGEVLASLELGHDFLADLEHYGLHPALFDIASTCALELSDFALPQDGKHALWAPVSYKRVRIHRPLPARVKSWVKSRDKNHAGSRVLLFDVIVTDEHGGVCVEIDEFAMHRLQLDLDHTTVGQASAFAAGPAKGPPAATFDARTSPARSALEFNAHRGITPAVGMEALQRIIGMPGLPQVVATSLDLDSLRRQADALAARVTPAASPAKGADVGFDRPELENEFVEPKDGIEKTLAGFWQELLGVRRVGLRDSFFDLGGHSLIAVRLFARIKNTYQVEFPISLLFEAPTIERCAVAIREATGASEGEESAAPQPQPEKPRFTHLVAMHPGQGGPKTPFVLVAGMFGNVLNLRHLAHLLGNERRFFGLQALGLYGEQKPRETFEEMASDYVAELRRVQPHGPYLLGGFSGGGITAYEMAQQLTAAGEEVALLAMLDTQLPQQPVLTANERARIHWDRIRRRGPIYVSEWAREKFRWGLAQIAKPGAGVARMPSEFRSEEIGAAFRRALVRYELRPYSGTVTLFRPKLDVAHVLGPTRMTNAQRDFVFQDNGWGAHAARVDVHEVPGDHDSMVLEPNVRVLAAKLRRCIQAVEPVAGHRRETVSAGAVESVRT